MLRVNVPLQHHPYEVLIGENLLQEAGSFISSAVKPHRVIILSDENIAPLYAQQLLDSLKKVHLPSTLITIPAGERSKSLRQVEEVSAKMFQAGLDRRSALLALGGGMIGDLGGFVAAIFHRGIPLIHLPTTLLAQIDSAIGGKTGVNTSFGKNLLGAFYQPRLVLSDITTLRTLPKNIFRDGFSEIIKHAIIADREMLDLIPAAITHKKEKELSELIARNVAIKSAIIIEDPYDTSNRRALLNFGHTIGHAIEAAGLYDTFSHGEAVALGMVAALDLSIRHAGLPYEEYQQIMNLFQSCNLPTQLPKNIPPNAIISALLRDKKFIAGKIHFVLTPRLGEAFVSTGITLEDIKKTLARIAL